ncbi:MAG: zf-HC2 domain-containing protein [Elusimicrobiota bacterium]
MKCNKFNREKINRYIDGELDGPEKTALESHVTECAHCRNYLNEIREVITIISKDAPSTVPGMMPEKVMNSVSPLRKYSRFLRYMALPAASAAVLLLVFIINGRNDTDELVYTYMEQQMEYIGIEENTYLTEQLENINGSGIIRDMYTDEEQTNEYVIDSYIASAKSDIDIGTIW